MSKKIRGNSVYYEQLDLARVKYNLSRRRRREREKGERREREIKRREFACGETGSSPLFLFRW
jgi:hypothetical protein